MTPKKFQIFVSSTYSDLADIRREVIDSIQRMNHFAVGMEQFSADDDEQWEIIQETIQQTDYYICLIGHRYGSIGNDGLSYTEMEWNYAKELGIPIMSFVRDRNTATTPGQRDSDSALARKLESFIEKTTAAKMVDFWSDPKDLNTKVVTALHKAFSRKPRPGWIRTESERVAEEMALLMEDNRSLRNQLEKATAQATGSRPVFKITLNGQPDLLLKTPPRSEFKLSPIPQVEQIDWEIIPTELKKFLTKREVEDYNTNIPTPPEIKKFYDRIHAVEIAKQTASPLTIRVENIGSAKAREVILDVVFPDSILVMEKEDFEETEAPDFKLPRNPVVVAKRKLKESEELKSPTSAFSSMMESIRGPNMSFLESITGRSAPNFDFVKTNYSCTIKKNKILIRIDNLMHTRHREFSGFIIVPTNPGVSEIEVSIICEEISVPHKQTIRLEVTDKVPSVANINP